jgi:O-methyltransferase
MLNALQQLLRDVRLRTPLRRFSPAFFRYEFMFNPAELAFLVRCLDETSGLRGPILEIGCAVGRTTVFLNRHLDDIGDARSYACVDTFSGFTQSDIDFEAERRKKPRTRLDGFRVNKKEWFDRNLADNGITRVRSFEADVNTFDLRQIAERFSFCLVDVDLYRPVKAALERVYPMMEPGGIIVVDDVKAESLFDGALQAYVEFTHEHGLSDERASKKLGVIRIPR